MTNQGKGKVLIADDDEDSRLMLSFLLTDEGWQVIEARDGQEAIEKAAQEHPQVILLDNRMPKASGVEVFKSLRAQGIEIPVILTTAYSDLHDLANRYGIPFCVPKPINFDNLLDIMETAIA